MFQSRLTFHCLIYLPFLTNYVFFFILSATLPRKENDNKLFNIHMAINDEALIIYFIRENWVKHLGAGISFCGPVWTTYSLWACMNNLQFVGLYEQPTICGPVWTTCNLWACMNKLKFYTNRSLVMQKLVCERK